MSILKVQIPKLHHGQMQIKTERKRRNVIDCGRRFGKNILLQDLSIETSLAHKLPIGWGAPVYKQMIEDYNSLSNLLAPVITRASVSEMRIDVIGGGTVKFYSLEKPNNIRGEKFARFIVNEAAFVPDLLDIRNYVIMPALIDMKGDEYYAGTPKGMNGFWNLYNQTGADWMKWKMSSYTNPHIDPAEIDSLRATMHERAYQQEIMAEFLEDGGGVFRNVMRCATAIKRTGDTASQYVIGVDWGRTYDATVFSVIDVAAREQVYLDRMTDTDFASQRIRLKALSDRFHRAVCVVEVNSIGQPQIEELQRMNIPVQGFQTTNATKAEIISALQLAFEQESIKILDDAIQTSELMAYQSERLPSGLLRYGAPEGMHDDTVMALCMAWWAASNVAPMPSKQPIKQSTFKTDGAGWSRKY